MDLHIFNLTLYYMERILYKKIFHIDSRKRDSGINDANFSITLPIESNEEFDSVVLLKCQIPKSYYMVRDGFNTFTLTENLTSITITIPVGNYNRRSFAIVLEQLLNTASLNNFIYTVSYNNSSKEGDTGKYSFTCQGFTLPPQFVFTENVFELLGFNPNSINTFIGGILISSNVIKLQLEDSIYIHSDICVNENGDNILEVVYSSTNDPTFSIISYEMIDLETNSKNINKSVSNTFKFTLTNENEQQLDLNGLNWVCDIMLYKKNAGLSSLIKGFIKYMTLKDN